VNKGNRVAIAFNYCLHTTALQHAAAQAPNDPRAWLCLDGFPRWTIGRIRLRKLSKAFIKLDPSNADSHYFLVCVLRSARLAGCIGNFRAALLLESLLRLPNSACRVTFERPVQSWTRLSRRSDRFHQPLTTANLSSRFPHTCGEEGSLGHRRTRPPMNRRWNRLFQ